MATTTRHYEVQAGPFAVAPGSLHTTSGTCGHAHTNLKEAVGCMWRVRAAYSSAPTVEIKAVEGGKRSVLTPKEIRQTFRLEMDNSLRQSALASNA